MAKLDNYYLLLGFSVENFINDKQTCLDTLEQKAKEWKASTNIQTRAKHETYYKSGDVRAAILNSKVWADQYFEAKAMIDDKIKNYLFAMSGTGYVSEDELKRLSERKELNVSVPYLSRVAASIGVRIKKNYTAELKKLSDYAPANPNKFRTPAKQLLVTGCGDYYDFLEKYSASGNGRNKFSQETPAQLCVSAAEKIQSSWSDKRASAEKSAVDQLCIAIKGFTGNDSDVSQTNYNKYLMWSQMKAILEQLWNALSIADQKIINENIKNAFTKRLNDIIYNRKDAEEVLISFCNEKGIEIMSTGAPAPFPEPEPVPEPEPAPTQRSFRSGNNSGRRDNRRDGGGPNRRQTLEPDSYENIYHIYEEHKKDRTLTPMIRMDLFYKYLDLIYTKDVWYNVEPDVIDAWAYILADENDQYQNVYSDKRVMNVLIMDSVARDAGNVNDSNSIYYSSFSGNKLDFTIINDSQKNDCIEKLAECMYKQIEAVKTAECGFRNFLPIQPYPPENDRVFLRLLDKVTNRYDPKFRVNIMGELIIIMYSFGEVNLYKAADILFRNKIELNEMEIFFRSRRAGDFFARNGIRRSYEAANEIIKKIDDFYRMSPIQKAVAVR